MFIRTVTVIRLSWVLRRKFIDGNPRVNTSDGNTIAYTQPLLRQEGWTHSQTEYLDQSNDFLLLLYFVDKKRERESGYLVLDSWNLKIQNCYHFSGTETDSKVKN